MNLQIGPTICICAGPKSAVKLAVIYQLKHTEPNQAHCFSEAGGYFFLVILTVEARNQARNL